MDKSLLAGFTIFAEADAAALDAIAGTCRVTEHRAGDEVFTQDTVAQEFYGVLEGKVELVLVFSEKVVSTTIEYEEALTVSHEVLERPFVVETLGAGDVFGWSSMVVPPGRWTATARCTAPTRVLRMPAAELQRLFEADPAVGYRFMRRLGGVISQRLHHRTEKLIDAWGEAFEGQVI
ncbi:MAG: cyclic nucleotide-binding domain-containing protein [Deferrisomatales bacterium]|nr:cyclic nucleotide-binding domain-containing protein [Deferrisomatales bacterium]HSH71008.1 cyclic nucleotide-binding domain-containing protein [Deferrisomatales bacterium]